ncbi:MAG: hypothetical protein K2P85_12520 [Flavobacteriaceae bacterium]|nr:hypothetical protein [Flavobacteriaceae bacterium]
MIRQDDPTPNTIKKITSFWNWFQKNEQTITKAVNQYDLQAPAIIVLHKKLKSISLRLHYLLKVTKNKNKKSTIVFSANGYRKLFGKVNALVNQAPELKSWQAEAFIKPTKDLEMYKQGLDEPLKFPDFEIKVSDLYFSIQDYNIEKKKLKIIIYYKSYRYHYDNDFLDEAIYIILQHLIGEITLRKNITFLELAQLPDNPKNLIQLIQIQEYIDKL